MIGTSTLTIRKISFMISVWPKAIKYNCINLFFSTLIENNKNVLEFKIIRPKLFFLMNSRPSLINTKTKLKLSRINLPDVQKTLRGTSIYMTIGWKNMFYTKTSTTKVRNNGKTFSWNILTISLDHQLKLKIKAFWCSSFNTIFLYWNKIPHCSRKWKRKSKH